MNRLPDELRSRKLAGLILGLGALLVLFVMYVIASIWSDVSDTIATAVASAITFLVGSHQGAQMMQDRAQAFSPNYPVPPSAPLVRPEPRPGDPVV